MIFIVRPFTVCAYKKQARPIAGLKEHDQGIRSVDGRLNAACGPVVGLSIDVRTLVQMAIKTACVLLTSCFSHVSHCK